MTVIRIREDINGVQSGAQFGQWTVVGNPFSIGGGHWGVVSVCSCNRVAVLRCNMLARGESSKCHSCVNRQQRFTHGLTRNHKVERLYNIWSGMKGRCSNERNKDYPRYGGRGIRVCEEWVRSYTSFREWALSSGYDAGLEIDRRDANGNYEPGNCRWADDVLNGRNKRNTIRTSAYGETKCIGEWAEDERCVVAYGTLRQRLAQGWSVERALTNPSLRLTTKRKDTLECSPPQVRR